MTVLVVADRPTSERVVAALPEASVEPVGTIDEALRFLADEEPAVAFVAVAALDERSPVDLRRRLSPRVPLVAVTDEPGPVDGFDDALVRPVEPDRVRAAVDRARLVSEYDDAIDELFRLCEERATADGAPTPELDATIAMVRERADDRLAALRDDEGRISFARLIQPS